MQKVAIVAHSSVQEELIAALHEAGVVEIRTTGDAPKLDHTEAEYKIADVDFASGVLKDFADKQTQAVAAKKVSVEDVIHTAKHTDVRSIVDALQEMEKQDTDMHKALQQLEEKCTVLEPWKGLKHALNCKSETDSVCIETGLLPAEKEAHLKDTLAQCMKRSLVETVSNDGKNVYCCVYIWKEDRETFEQKSTALGWSSIDLPKADTPAAAAYEETLLEKRRLEEDLQKNVAKRQKLAVELPNLIKVRLFMHWLQEKQQVREAMGSTESTVTILCWTPKVEVEALEKRLQEVSSAVAVLKVKPDEGEEVPVLLKNPKIVTPFESVTGLYGLPLSHEMDPTRSLSPFFILYFSLCLTDAGYGAMLMLIFGITLAVTKKSIEEAKLLWLLFFGGIMTFLVSIPFGGWFGLTPEQVPEMFTKTTESGLLFKGQIWNLNAQSGIDFLQNLSLVLGITHLFFGMWLAGVHKWVHGKKVEAFWMDFTSHILLGTIILFALQPTPHTKYALYGAIALMIWGKGHGAKWFVRPIVGLLGMLNFVIGMISNGLSYLRILALGLVTGAIAAAINQVAVEMGKLFPTWLAIPVIVLIFVGGHIVSIALNTLGSFIHSGRLQFIEFFSQFFEGGGREFSPFKRST